MPLSKPSDKEKIGLVFQPLHFEADRPDSVRATAQHLTGLHPVRPEVASKPEDRQVLVDVSPSPAAEPLGLSQAVIYDELLSLLESRALGVGFIGARHVRHLPVEDD